LFRTSGCFHFRLLLLLTNLFGGFTAFQRFLKGYVGRLKISGLLGVDLKIVLSDVCLVLAPNSGENVWEDEVKLRIAKQLLVEIMDKFMNPVRILLEDSENNNKAPQKKKRRLFSYESTFKQRATTILERLEVSIETVHIRYEEPCDGPTALSCNAFGLLLPCIKLTNANLTPTESVTRESSDTRASFDQGIKAHRSPPREGRTLDGSTRTSFDNGVSGSSLAGGSSGSGSGKKGKKQRIPSAGSRTEEGGGSLLSKRLKLSKVSIYCDNNVESMIPVLQGGTKTAETAKQFKENFTTEKHTGLLFNVTAELQIDVERLHHINSGNLMENYNVRTVRAEIKHQQDGSTQTP
jgi:hypothetical protein